MKNILITIGIVITFSFGRYYEFHLKEMEMEKLQVKVDKLCQKEIKELKTAKNEEVAKVFVLEKETKLLNRVLARKPIYRCKECKKKECKGLVELLIERGISSENNIYNLIKK